MLGPVTAVLALNIYNQRAILKEHFLPVLAGCLAGSLTSVGSVLLLCRVFHVDDALAASLLPKSVTTAIAIGIAESRGGIGGIAAAAVMVAGLTGAVFAPSSPSCSTSPTPWRRGWPSGPAPTPWAPPGPWRSARSRGP